MESGSQESAHVVVLVRICGHAYAVTRKAGELVIRRLPRPPEGARTPDQRSALRLLRRED